MEKYDVFISYSRADYQDEKKKPIPGNVISQIKEELDKESISYWIDESGISAGDQFAPIIAKAIKNSSVFVFVSTENSNKSEWTQSEISTARMYQKVIIPFKCDESAYADSVIMYLAALDMCDYKTNPKLALKRL